jgi:hypothetical protein
MPIGSPLGVTLPVVEVTPGPAWASLVNQALQALIDSVEAKVTPAGISIDADLDAKGQAVTGLDRLRLQNRGALSGPTNARSLYVRDGELYYNDGAGNEVKLTDGGSLNAAALGGFTGDYGLGAEAAHYSAAATRFRFTSAADVNAELDTGDILLRQRAAAALAIKVKSPAGLAAAIERVLLGANPASTSLLTISSSGVEAATRAPSVDSLAASGTVTANAASVSGTVTAATVSATTVSAGSVTGSGSITTAEADIRHGARTVQADPILGRSESSASWTVTAARTIGSPSGGGTWWWGCPPLAAGDRITGLRVRYSRISGTITIRMMRQPIGAGGSPQVVTTMTISAGTGEAIADFTGLSLPHTVVADNTYYLEFTTGAASNALFTSLVTFDRP